jgi:hypothetical protein
MAYYRIPITQITILEGIRDGIAFTNEQDILNCIRSRDELRFELVFQNDYTRIYRNMNPSFVETHTVVLIQRNGEVIESYTPDDLDKLIFNR